MNQPPRVSSSLSDVGSTSSTSSTRSKLSMTSIRMTNLYKATMNRFLTRKKTEAALEGTDAPPPTARKSKKGKKNKEEQPKPELDLSQALPSTDNFRTSLLMPNLSARFSMLREQDDPESKMGKASDDSVLFPKRQSRLTDYGFNPVGLTDIAEVASINESLRPPFLAGRSGSVDYGTDDGDSVHSGSVMSRSRPGEGNVLFGGRQKVYLGNRTLYDDDVGMSAYQRMRAEERRKKREEEGGEQDDDEDEEEPESPAHELKHSSSFSGSLRRRETASSTTSGAGARASTAATSIASQGANAVPPPERAGTKGRRLYDQGLDRNFIEGNSAISRLNSLQQQRTGTTGRATPPLTQTRSATNLSDRYNRAGQYRPASPPPSAPLANMASFKAARDGDSQQSSPVVATSSPTSPFPPISPLEDNSPLASAIQPGDRGKATAMGAFNKPAQKFDENQYLQRQKQMLQGRETPPPRKPSRSPSRAVQERLNKFEMKSREPEVRLKQPPALSKNVSDARKRLDVLRSEIAADLDDLRPSSDSEDEPAKKVEERPGRSRSRTNSSSVVPRAIASPPKSTILPDPVSPPTQALPPTPSSPPRQIPAGNPASPPKRALPPKPTEDEMLPPEPASPEPPAKPSPFSVFQRAKQQMQTQPSVESAESPKKGQMTFFSSRNSSDDEDDDAVPEVQPMRSPVNRTVSRPGSKPQSPVALRSNSSAGVSPSLRSPPPVHEHPALRSPPSLASPASRASETMRQALNSPHDSERKSSVSTMVKSDATDLDSPTLGPESGGLNGMIRQHLRNQSQHSGVSSVYDDREEDDDNEHSKSSHLAAGSMVSDTPVHSSYSHSNPWDLEDLDGSYYGEADSLSSVSPVDGSKSKTQAFPRPAANVESPRSEPPKDQQPDRDQVAPWEQEMKSKHSRNVSHTTLAEREAFQKDLEERQKAIQEALKSKVEGSRSGSPTPSMGGAMKAFGMLRAKSSRDALVSRPGGNSKAINMLGMGANASNASLNRTSEEHLRKQRERLANSPMPSDDDYRREFEDILTRGASGSAQSSKSRSPSANGTGRSRSNSQMSAVSGRSRSRTGNRESAEQTPPPIPSQVPRSGIPTPDSMPSASPVVEPPPNPPALRMRSGSRPSMPGYFDQKSLHPIQTGIANGMSRISPASAGPTPHVSPGFAPGRSTIAPGSRSAGHSPGIAPMSAKAAAFAAHANHSSPAIASPPPPRRSAGAVPPERKKSIAKSIISEPMFVSSTSVVDTIELPAGASLKNGMDEAPPPVPPINPMRRRFGFGRSDSSSTTTSDGRPSTDDGDNKSRTRMRKSSNTSLYRAANDGPTAIRPPPVEEGAMF